MRTTKDFSSNEKRIFTEIITRLTELDFKINNNTRKIEVLAQLNKEMKNIIIHEINNDNCSVRDFQSYKEMTQKNITEIENLKKENKLLSQEWKQKEKEHDKMFE